MIAAWRDAFRRCRFDRSLPFLARNMIARSTLAALVAAPVIGSFLSVIVVRLPHGLPIAWDRSRCPHCHRTLAPRDLVPLLSWLITLGRCRYCARQISLLYPGLELA